MNQSKLELSACCWRKARGNACERVTIGLDFTSDWMKNWREFFKPIVCCSWCNTKYFSFPIFPFCRIATSSVTRQSKHTWTLSALMLILQNVKWSYSYVTPNLKVRLASQSVSCAVRHPFISLASHNTTLSFYSILWLRLEIFRQRPKRWTNLAKQSRQPKVKKQDEITEIVEFESWPLRD